jgi:hypothetical protein
MRQPAVAMAQGTQHVVRRLLPVAKLATGWGKYLGNNMTKNYDKLKGKSNSYRVRFITEVSLGCYLRALSLSLLLACQPTL